MNGGSASLDPAAALGGVRMEGADCLDSMRAHVIEGNDQ